MSEALKFGYPPPNFRYVIPSFSHFVVTGIGMGNATKPIKLTGPTSAVIYVRVSTEDQAQSGLGLEAQLEACRAMCVARGWVIAGEFSDPGVSGRTDPLARDGFSGALDAYRTYPNTVLVVYAVSRLTRRQSVLWRFLDEEGDFRLRLVSSTEPFDTSTPLGRAMVGMLGVWAQLEADMISDRTKAALAARRARGLPLGPPAIADKNPELVERIGLMYSVQGFKLQQIVDTLNSEGIPSPRGGKWGTSTVQRLVTQSRGNREPNEAGGGAADPATPTG